jgi:flavorubredoxin
MSTKSQADTRIDEIGEGLFRINTPVHIPGGAFSFNQYLLLDDDPLLFHTGPVGISSQVMATINRAVPLNRLRYVAFSHFEADECGALNHLLQQAPQAVPLCGRIAAMTSIADVALRPPRVMMDEEDLSLGRRTVRWFDTPHLPHSWESGLLMERSTRTLFCGDLLTQGGQGDVALTTEDIVGPSEAFRLEMDYYSHSPATDAMIARLAAQEPRLLACMHGSAWSGNGRAALDALRTSLRESSGRAATEAPRPASAAALDR